MNEYDALRTEIANNSTRIAQIFTISISAVAALLGFGLKSEPMIWYFFLSVFAILIPSLSYIISQLRSTVIISTYIMTFYESLGDASSDCKPSMAWESRLYKLRFQSKEQNIQNGSDRLFVSSISHLYLGLGFVAAALSILTAYKGPNSQMVVCVPISVFLIVYQFYLNTQFRSVLDKPFIDKYIDQWKHIESLGNRNS